MTVARLLQLVKPADHLPGVEPVGRAQVFSAAFVHGFRLLFGVREGQPRSSCQRVHEEEFVGREPHRIAARSDGIEVRL